MNSLIRSALATIFGLVWSMGPALAEPQSVNLRMKILSNQLGISYNKLKPDNVKRISMGQFLDRLKPLMTEVQYKKFAKYVEPYKKNELPEVTIEANKLFLKEGGDAIRLQAERNPEAVISVAGVLMPNADFEDVDAALNKIEALVLKDRQKNASLLDKIGEEIFPHAEAWLWPLAIVAAAGLFGYFLYKGMTNMKADVNVAGGTTNTLDVTGDVKTTSDINIGLGVTPFNIHSTGATK
ncbi:MAG: hypothetical protein IPJ71_15020 [Bdellovibrionales bacterium]|nr:hypothetical protein [Bdellovibrionales bacterium]